MRKLGRQAVLNRVWKHLRKQGVQCTTSGGGCVYRGPEGRMCAIGALIPNSLYTEDFELYLANQLLDPSWDKHFDATKRTEDFIKRLGKFRGQFAPDVTPTFLRQLQSIHDATIPQLWEGELAMFATRNTLKHLPA